MIKQIIDIEGYWSVIIYYNVDYRYSVFLQKELENIGVDAEFIPEILSTLESGEAKAVTCSNLNRHTSVVLFNVHTSSTDYVNSIVHEAEHVKQAMLDAYDVEDIGEPPAYTIGYLVGKMYRTFRQIVCKKQSY